MTLKFLTGSTLAGSVVLAIKMASLSAEIGATVMPKVVAKVTTKLMAVSGMKLVAKIGGEMAGPLVGLGVVIWDVVDHQRVVTMQRPLLRRTIEEYLEQAYADGRIELPEVPEDTKDSAKRYAPGFTAGGRSPESGDRVYTAKTVGEYLGWMREDGRPTEAPW